MRPLPRSKGPTSTSQPFLKVVRTNPYRNRGHPDIMVNHQFCQVLSVNPQYLLLPIYDTWLWASAANVDVVGKISLFTRCSRNASIFIAVLPRMLFPREQPAKDIIRNMP